MSLTVLAFFHWHNKKVGRYNKRKKSLIFAKVLGSHDYYHVARRPFTLGVGR
jgi:hypothetical protein